jgi:GYF domain 2
MSNRSWFFASQGQQQGPYPDAQLREFIASGTVTAGTLVWTEGMTGWQKAGEIPGLFSGASRPPALSPSGPPLMGAGSYDGEPLSVDFSIWALLGRTLLFLIGFLLVIPAPWVATGFYGWFVERLHVPQRPNLEFTGKPLDIWYVFVILALFSYVGFAHVAFLPLILIPVQAYLSWMTVKWVVANISSDGRPLSLSFEGSPWGYIGWYVLLFVSAFTIIGWAWVTTAWLRWMCGNINGIRRELLFNGSGWQVLWRTLVFVLLAMLIIPIPWVLGWFARWYVAQFELVERAA